MEAALVRELVQVAAGDMRHKLQPGAPRARRAGQGRQGWAPVAPWPSTAPIADFTVLLLSLTPGL